MRWAIKKFDLDDPRFNPRPCCKQLLVSCSRHLDRVVGENAALNGEDQCFRVAFRNRAEATVERVIQRGGPKRMVTAFEKTYRGYQRRIPMFVPQGGHWRPLLV